MVKSFLIGVTAGAIAVAPLAYNHGRGAALFSNPLEERTLGTILKERGDALLHLVDDVKKELARSK